MKELTTAKGDSACANEGTTPFWLICWARCVTLTERKEEEQKKTTEKQGIKGPQ